jgi:thimet oligopeptidase
MKKALILTALLAAAALLAACPKPAPKGPTAEPDAPIKEPTIFTTPAEVAAAQKDGLAAADQLRAKIVAVTGKRTEANTLVPMNLLLTGLDRLVPLCELTGNTHGDKAVPEAGLDPLAARFRRLLLRDYRRAGVDKDEATRKQLAALDARMVELGQTFDKNIRQDKKTLDVTEAELEGVPADFIAAKKRALTPEGKIRLTTDYTDFFTVEAYAKQEAVRQELYRLFLTKAHPVNVGVLKQLLETRHQYARMLGFETWADYYAEDKMVKRRQVVQDFLVKVADLSRPRMQAELRDILARKQKDVPGATIVGAWDRFYYVNRIQSERFDVKPEEVRAYFDFRNVKAGLLEISQELFGVTFRKVDGAPVWHPQVEAYDVLEGGKRIARFYLDPHPREGKYGHAAVFPIQSGVIGVQLPAAALVTNFADPSKTAGGPALMEFNQVTTFFHEFGHLLHHVLGGRHRWVTQSGIACEWDFVEAPSQIYEEWPRDAGVLARFARHHQTGQPIPAALVARMRKAEEFGKGVHVMRQMFYAYLSYAFHAADVSQLDLMTLQQDIQKRFSPYPHQAGTAEFASFGHLNGYSSAYYTYMWSLVLAKDLFTRFEKAGLLDKDTARAYLRAVLSRGGSADAADLVQEFLGRPYSFEAFRQWLERN